MLRVRSDENGFQDKRFIKILEKTFLAIRLQLNLWQKILHLRQQIIRPEQIHEPQVPIGDKCLVANCTINENLFFVTT